MEWSAGDDAQKPRAAEPPSTHSGAPDDDDDAWGRWMAKGYEVGGAEPYSTRSGAASSSAPMEVEADECTTEQLQHARDAAQDVRRSLYLAYNRVLDIIGSCGLAFKKPQPAAAPAAAAVHSEAPQKIS